MNAMLRTNILLMYFVFDCVPFHVFVAWLLHDLILLNKLYWKEYLLLTGFISYCWMDIAASTEKRGKWWKADDGMLICIDLFWVKIFSLCNDRGLKKYPHLAKVSSNATVIKWSLNWYSYVKCLKKIVFLCT